MNPFPPPSPRPVPVSLPTSSVHLTPTYPLLHLRADVTTTSSTTASTTTTASSTTSTYDPATNQPNAVNLSSTSVIAIGLGFVAIASTVMTLFISFRAIKCARKARALRAAGDTTVTFRDLWRTEGGVMGMIAPPNSTMMGGHGHWGGGDMGTLRRIEAFWGVNGRMDEGEWDKAEKPGMWEVDIGGRGGGRRKGGSNEEKGEKGEDGDLDGVEPLALIASPRPEPDLDQTKVSLLPDPSLSISILIRLPSADPQPSPPSPSPRIGRYDEKAGEDEDEDEDEAEEEPRDLIIGTMTLIPVLPIGGNRSGDVRTSMSISTVSLVKGEIGEVGEVGGTGEKGEKGEHEVGHLGYMDTGEGGERRARWVVGQEGAWGIENLE